MTLISPFLGFFEGGVSRFKRSASVSPRAHSRHANRYASPLILLIWRNKQRSPLYLVLSLPTPSSCLDSQSLLPEEISVKDDKRLY